MWAGFFCRQDVSISIFGRTKEFSEVRGRSLMCNFGVRSRFLDVIYGVRPPNGSPDVSFQLMGITDNHNYTRNHDKITLSLIANNQTNKHHRQQLGRLSLDLRWSLISTKIGSEYDKEIPQTQTADKPMAPRGRATQQSRDTRKTN